MIVSAPPSPIDADVVVDLDPAARALAAVAVAVARTHGIEVTCTVTTTSGPHAAVCLRFLPADEPQPATFTRAPFDELRAGLGLRLPLAAVVLRHGGGQLHDLVRDAAAAGVDVLLPLAPR